MQDRSIDLSVYEDRFSPGTKLLLDKRLNFIFGKNGTGKSTITKAIMENTFVGYKSYCFNGFEGIVSEDRKLNAIALGNENVEIQGQIEFLDKEIEQIRKEIVDDKESDNIANKVHKEREKVDKQNQSLQIFFSASASELKNKEDPRIVTIGYDKNDFEKDIQYAKKLDSQEIEKYTNIIKEDEKMPIPLETFPMLRGEELLGKTNELLLKSVSIKEKIISLHGEKQFFAREGMKIHEHKKGEKCAFCGNEISMERRELLENYFNDDVTNLEKKIDSAIITIEQEEKRMKEITPINQTLFYKQFSPTIEELNKDIEIIKNKYELFLGELLGSLKDKKKKLFTPLSTLVVDMPNDFTLIQSKFDEISQSNNRISNNIIEEKEKAKNQLCYHEIEIKLKDFNYIAQKQKLEDLQKSFDGLNKELNKKREDLQKKEDQKQELLSKLKDEEKIAIMINECLEKTGIESFKLEPASTDGGEKGYYQVRGHNGNTRSIENLSTGEKNIIAFLYFIFSFLGIEKRSNEKKIIIFDDPMTSNDDTMQYLMISKLSGFYGDNRIVTDNDIFILLTHNIHFYLNARPRYNPAEDNRESDNNKKYHMKNNYHKLQSNGKLSTILPIKSYEEDFKSNYHALRDDFKFLYENDKPISMINCGRRILETYINFYGYNPNSFYKDNEEARKLFNVNSHGIDDLENEPNGKTPEQIKEILKGVLKDNNSEEHFEIYFNK